MVKINLREKCRLQDKGERKQKSKAKGREDKNKTVPLLMMPY